MNDKIAYTSVTMGWLAQPLEDQHEDAQALNQL